eukprot:2729614-Pyramimonas_sp.AAC.2
MPAAGIVTMCKRIDVSPVAGEGRGMEPCERSPGHLRKGQDRLDMVSSIYAIQRFIDALAAKCCSGQILSMFNQVGACVRALAPQVSRMR